jgi:DNA-binding CsgD family transcriptional regulator
MRDTGAHAIVGPLAAIAAELLVERDRVDEAADIVDALDPVIFDTIAGPFAMASRGLVRQRQHRLDDAESDLRAAIALLDARGWFAPLVTGARLRLVEVLCAKGKVDEARALAEANVAVARGAGTEGALGASLRGEGIARGDLDVLREAAERLAATPLRLEYGWALHDLGAWLRRAGSRAAAREPLRQALDVSTRAEASLLARSARDELVATGAPAVRETLTGPSSLTPSERRVAELAAQGLSNREIAETLWVTRKTVELHLGNAYGKLDIRSRSQLPEALAA